MLVLGQWGCRKGICVLLSTVRRSHFVCDKRVKGADLLENAIFSDSCVVKPFECVHRDSSKLERFILSRWWK